MSDLQDRVGVFLVPARYEAALERAAKAVADNEFDEYGQFGPSAWYHARHQLFELLLEHASVKRVVPGDTLSALGTWVSSLDRRTRAWERATPRDRRALAAKYLSRVTDNRLRAAIEEVLAEPAKTNEGLWIESESAPPGTIAGPHDLEGEHHPPVEDVARALDEYIAEADQRWPVDERDEAAYQAYLCELSDEDARFAAEAWQGVDSDDVDASIRANEEAAGRARLTAIATTEDTKRTLVDAIDRMRERMTSPSLAPGIYDARQARDLLVEISKERRSLARDRVLAVLRRAVKANHGFAIILQST